MRLSFFSFFFFLLFSVIGISSLSCDSPSEKSQPPKETLLPASREAWIPAATGGRVALDDGAYVDFPAGALTADVTVILERVSCDGYLRHPDFSGCIHEVRAQGEAALAGRYTLALPDAAREEAAEAPSMRNCILGAGEEGLRCQGDFETASGNTALTTASRFGAFTRFSPQVRTSAPTLVHDMPFLACEGDPTGDWELVFIMAPLDAMGIGSSSGGENFSDCPNLSFLEFRTVEYHERLRIQPSMDAFAVYTFRKDYGFQTDLFRYFTPECLGLHGRECQEACTMEEGVCRCFWNESMGNGSNDSFLLEDADGGLHLDAIPNPLLYCVQGDTLALYHEHPEGPVLKIFRRK